MRCLATRRDDLAARANLGWTYLDLGLARAARVELERCLAVDPTFGPALAGLDALASRGGLEATARSFPANRPGRETTGTTGLRDDRSGKHDRRGALGAASPGPAASEAPRRSGRALHVAILVVIMVVAAGLRLHRLADFPPGLFIDQAQYGLDAYRISQGETFPVFVEGPGGNKERGREPLFMYLMAGSSWWPGRRRSRSSSPRC